MKKKLTKKDRTKARRANKPAARRAVKRERADHIILDDVVTAELSEQQDQVATDNGIETTDERVPMETHGA